MLHARIIASLVSCMLVVAAVCFAQMPGEAEHDQAIAAQRPMSPETFQLLKDLKVAKRAGQIDRVHEIEAQIIGDLPTLPPEPSSTDFAMESSGTEYIAKPTWGGDVLVYAGDLWSYGKREIAIDADTVGGIYIAMNLVYRDTLSMLRLHKSTDGGASWSLIGWATNPVYSFQSMDMCVTDTAGGRWLLSVVFVLKNDRSANGGGSLHWWQMLDNGTHSQLKAIAPTTASMEFRNPSICTDGAYYLPGSTYHFIAAEYCTPSTDESRGIYIRKTTDYGTTWGTPDTSLSGYQEETPVIGLSWGTNPDSLVVAFTRTFTGGKRIRIARAAKILPATWTISYPDAPTEEFDPSLAMDPASRKAIVAYTRTSASTHTDAMYYVTTDLFKTFTRDSIAASTSAERMTSVAYAPYLPGYYWRVAYSSGDTIFYKGLQNSEHSFYTVPPTRVNQFDASGIVAPVVGSMKDPNFGSLGNVVYAGYGPKNVYFDAVSLYLDDVRQSSSLPGEYALFQNYPNPFNPTTKVGYVVGGVVAPSGSEGPATKVRLAVYDLLGREVAVLVNEMKTPGTYQVQFDGSGLASGLYIIRMVSGSYCESRKMMLLR